MIKPVAGPSKYLIRRYLGLAAALAVASYGLATLGPAQASDDGSHGAPRTRRATASRRAKFRSQCFCLYPVDAAKPDSGDGRLDRGPASTQSVRDAALLVVLRTWHLRHSRQPAEIPGRLLHAGRRSRGLARRRRDQRLDRRVQSVLPDDDAGNNELHRLGQFLAVAVEPVDRLACRH